MPVLPLVGSMITVSRSIRPAFSAASIMLTPMRSFTLDERIEELALGVDLRLHPRGDAVEPDQRRVADGLGDVLVETRHENPLDPQDEHDRSPQRNTKKSWCSSWSSRSSWSQPSSRCFSSSLTIAGLALPCVAFITWPTKKPKSLSLPPRYSATLSALAASTASMAASMAPLVGHLASGPARRRSPPAPCRSPPSPRRPSWRSCR